MMKRILLIFLVLFPCLVGQSKNRKNNPFPDDVHVMLIGFDGWGSHCMKKADMPVLREMMQQGSWTMKKRSVLPSSSAANWASMFMGASPEIHGYTLWNSQKPEIPSMVLGENKIFPTIFQLLHYQKGNAEIGLFYQWSGVKYIVDTLSINHVEQLPKPGRDGKFTRISKIIADYIIEKRPDLCSVVYDYPDHYGHASGFESEAYYQSLEEVDVSLGDIIQATKDAGIFEKTIFIVSSDHGGIGKSHGGKSLAEMETPFVIYGNNIKKDFEITDSMMQFDIAATIAYIFGLEVPQVWIGRPVQSVFEKIR